MRQLVGLIDWMMQLPEELEYQFNDNAYRFQEDRGTPYVTSFKRMGMKKGLEQGLEQGAWRDCGKGSW